MDIVVTGEKDTTSDDEWFAQIGSPSLTMGDCQYCSKKNLGDQDFPLDEKSIVAPAETVDQQCEMTAF